MCYKKSNSKPSIGFYNNNNCKKKKRKRKQLLNDKLHH